MTKNIKSKTIAIVTKATTEVVNDERQITAIVSSSNTDRDNERVDIGSLRLPLKGGGGYVRASEVAGGEQLDVPLTKNHSWDVADVIGSARSARYDAANNELAMTFGISKRAIAQDLMVLIDEKHLDNAMSVTMSDYDMIDGVISDAELLAVGLVWRASNKDARIVDVKSVKEKKKMTIEEKKAEIARLQKEVEGEKTAEEKAAEAKAEQEAKEKAAKEAVEKEQKEKEQAAVNKSIAVKQVKDKTTPSHPVTPKQDADFDKVEFTAKQFVAWVNKDFSALAELNKKAIESYADIKGKATYMNTAVTADGGAIVPSAQLMADVFTTLGEFSTVANDLYPVTLTSGDSMDVATLITDVIMTEVGTEGGAKPTTKPVLGDGNVSLREFAGIAVITKKLVRQAAINVYDLLRQSFARAIANRRAVMALTDATTGIVNKEGVVEVVGDMDWATVKQMPYSIPAAAVQGAKYYISRELLAALDGETDSTGRDLDIVKLSGDGLSGTFKNGFAFAVEETLGQNGDPHAVFGAMGRFGILLRQGTVESETFDTGTVTDGSSVVHNLLQENKLANRVAFYENVGYPLPGAFSVLIDAES